MEKDKVIAILILVLSGLVLIGVLLSHLALTDIYHGIEPNLETEWWIVRITFVLVVGLALSSGYLALRVVRGGNR